MKKGPHRAIFVLKPNSLSQPGLDGVRAKFSFPFLQRFVVAAFGFDVFRLSIIRQLYGEHQIRNDVILITPSWMRHERGKIVFGYYSRAELTRIIATPINK